MAAHGIPLLEAPPLARSMVKYVDIGHEVPAELYSAVAEVLAWAFQVRHHRAGLVDEPPVPASLAIPEDYEVGAP